MPIEQETVVWSNADEVMTFIEDHDNCRFEVGHAFTLPDIGQTYTVIAARPFRRNKSFYLFLDLETVCAVEDCSNLFVISVDVNRWRKSRHLTRCCQEHSYKFSTSMPYAWKTADERYALQQRDDERARRRALVEAERERQRNEVKVGSVEQIVLSTAQDLDLVSPHPSVDAVVTAAVPKLRPSAAGLRDTRKQQAVRAYHRLREKGLL